MQPLPGESVKNMKSAQVTSLAKRANRITKSTQLKGSLWVSLLVCFLAFLIAFAWSKSLTPQSVTPSPTTLNSLEVSSKGNAITTRDTSTPERAARISAINNLVFADTDMAWVYNNKGELLLTQDAGESWAPIGGVATKHFDAFTIIDGYRGWAVDSQGKIWKTENGGHNWFATSLLQPQYPDEYSYMGASQILFTGESNGWIIDTLMVWRTQDDGLSWHEVNKLSYEKLKRRVRSMYFLNAQSGWAICDGLILQTDDGGNNWRSIVDNLSLDITNNINAVHFIDANHGWIAISDAPEPFPENVVLFTEDNGRTWHPQNELSRHVSIRSIFFLNNKVGWMGGRLLNSRVKPGVLFRTQDGGHTWLNLRTVPSNDFIESVHFTSIDEGWLATDYSIYRTKDGGKTWSTVLSYPEVKRRNVQILGREESNN
jgi:photosystem II stability/assembly factor-like uncharacterized protein